jgi:threonine/homoserine/homoserine lactone efflux protein
VAPKDIVSGTAMTAELILAFAGYAFVTSITPGPNNAMLLASGVNFGFARTIPHIAGINLGFGAMVLAVGLGAGSILTLYPSLYLILKIVGAGYLAYLAWLIATSTSIEADKSAGSPMTFLGAAAFQWVNPKAWIMVIGAVSTYVPPHGSWTSIVLLTAIYVLVNAPCIIVWAGFGHVVRRWLTPRSLVWFNRTMAVLLLVSLYPVAVDLAAAVKSLG